MSDSVNPVFLDDVVQGLLDQPKRLQCKYFYDERGSQLFDEICKLDEYYLTRTEMAIMDKFVDEMAYQIGTEVMLVEFGSGSSIKTRKLLDALDRPVAYVPVDISEDHLLKTAATLQSNYPKTEILPVVADFTAGFELPASQVRPSHAAVYFPGSTIGNFTPEGAADLLAKIARVLGPKGGLLIGIDLQKDPELITAAYNDEQGVTAEFNLNLLHRINKELDGDIDVSGFEHNAVYNPTLGRVEISLISKLDQTVQVNGHQFQFGENEPVLTEYSHKYTIEGFAEMAKISNFSLRKYWTDTEALFAVLHLVNDRG